jgi:hypothetical protein
MALFVGATARVHGLLTRADLNECLGVIVYANPLRTDRLGVLMSDASAPIAIKPDNLTRVAAVCDAALADVDLLRVILTFVPRWVRAGVLSGTCKYWREVVFSHSDLYHSIVLLASTTIVPRNQMRTSQYGAAHFVCEGALPMVPGSQSLSAYHPLRLCELPDPAYVEKIFVEDSGKGLLTSATDFDQHEHSMHMAYEQTKALLERTFPRLTTLLITSLQASCEHHERTLGLSLQDEDTGFTAWHERVVKCREWFDRHLAEAPLQHLHLNGDSVVTHTGRYPSQPYAHRMSTCVLFDASQQPGLASLTLSDGGAPLEIIKGWSAEVRAKLTALDINSLADIRPLMEDEVGCHLEAAVDALPNLRRLSLSCHGVDTPFYAGELLRIGAKLEAMYVNISETSMPTWVFDCPWANPSSLKEFAVYCERTLIRDC